LFSILRPPLALIGRDPPRLVAKIPGNRATFLWMLGLAQFTARLLWRLDGDWYRAFNIFDIHTAPQTFC
jgi:hypothetical protein